MTLFKENLMIAEFSEKLGDRQFFTVQDLQLFGLYRTLESARKALKNGDLPYIRVSPRRRLISRAILLKFIRDNFLENEGLLPKTKRKLVRRGRK